MLYGLVLIGGLLVVLSLRSFHGGIRFLRYVRAALTVGLRSERLPLVTVFAPCRGAEPQLRENLKAVLRQEYPEYEVLFVADNRSDPAVEIIEDLIATDLPAGVRSARLIIIEPENRSGRKVEVLRGAVSYADQGSEIFVFFDSDGCPRPDWLASLIKPLAREDVGAATGYRWFLPRQGALWSELRSAWNASIASALGGNERTNFCWGGSTAIRRGTFDHLRIADRWLGTASDDFILTREIRRAGKGIVFVPRALVVAGDGCSLTDLLEFTTRQMKITRVYAPNLWLASLLGSGLFVFVTLLAVAVLIYGVIVAERSAVITSAAVLALVAIPSIGKVIVRARAIAYAMPDLAGPIRRQAAIHCFLWPLATYLFFANAVAAAISRRIVWRGIAYNLVSDSELEILGPDATKDEPKRRR